MKWEEGKVIQFKGCCWDAHWQFDAPLIIYSPIKRYSFSGSICKEAIYDAVEDIGIDLCGYENVANGFSDWDLKEFKWRGWSLRGFSRRKNAIHATYLMKLQYDEDGERSFEIVEHSEPAIP